MGKNQLRADDVQGYLLAAHDELRDTELRYGLTCYSRVILSQKRGTLKFVMVAVRRSETMEEVEYARAEREWPSARYTSLHALLYACAMSLNIAVQRAYFNENGHFLGDAPAEARKG